jgi:hypothetical protein
MALLGVAAYPSAADPVPVGGYEGDLLFSVELADTTPVPFQPILLRLTVTNLAEDTVEVTHPFIGGGWPLTLEWRERGDETWNAAQHAAGHAPWWEAALQAAGPPSHAPLSLAPAETMRAAFDCLVTLAYGTDVDDPESTAAAVARAAKVIGDSFLADRIPSALAEARYRQAGRRGWKAQLRWVVHYGDRNSAARDPKKAREAMNEAERLHQQAAAEWIRRQEDIGDFERLAWTRYQISLEELTLERARGLYGGGD